MTISGGSFSGELYVYAQAADSFDIVGGTFDTDISAYVPEGMEIETDGDGNMTVVSPIRFETSMIYAHSQTFQLPIVITDGVPVEYSSSISGVIVGDGAIVTLPEGIEEETFTITATATVSGVEFSATIDVVVKTYLGITAEGSDIGLMVTGSAISDDVFRSNYDRIVGISDGIGADDGR